MELLLCLVLQTRDSSLLKRCASLLPVTVTVCCIGYKPLDIPSWGLLLLLNKPAVYKYALSPVCLVCTYMCEAGCYIGGSTHRYSPLQHVVPKLAVIHNTHVAVTDPQTFACTGCVSNNNILSHMHSAVTTG